MKALLYFLNTGFRGDLMNEKYLTMNTLPIGEKATVMQLNLKGDLLRRIIDIGMIKGTTVEALCRSPSGDPTAYSVKGSVIALRSEDAEKIILKPFSS